MRWISLSADWFDGSNPQARMWTGCEDTAKTARRFARSLDPDGTDRWLRRCFECEIQSRLDRRRQPYDWIGIRRFGSQMRLVPDFYRS
jgi:hypothetical protein